jgi:hypothetical protein
MQNDERVEQRRAGLRGALSTSEEKPMVGGTSRDGAGGVLNT